MSAKRGRGRGAYLGLDIGAQSVKGLRLERDGGISFRASLPTPASSGARAVLATVAELARGLRGRSPLAATGVGTPGGVDAEGRVAGEAANIPGWPGADLKAEVERAAGSPASVRNDGNLAAFAEWAARGGSSRALLFVGLGTGVGGGYIEDGRILGGTDDKALEIGHAIVYPGGRSCACGRSGCAEAYASGPSIGRIALELSGGYDSPLARLARSGAAFNAREVYDALALGDALAEATHQVAAHALARVIGTAIALLAPDTVVLGGGVMAGASRLLEDISALAPLHVYPAACEGLTFEAALLGADSGLMGAALYAASTILPREELLGLASRALDSLGRKG
jgi:predicted NBD/HSP70 family sugar kinase